jgi:hypothetical protein
MTRGVSGRGRANTAIQLPLLPAPACSTSNCSFAAKRHGIVLDRHSNKTRITYRKHSPFVVLLLGGVVRRLQQYFCQIPPPFCRMFRFTGCRNRMISLPGCPTTMKNTISEGTENSRDMRESQRALELRKYAAPLEE